MIETREPGLESPPGQAGDLARRILQLERADLRERFARRGVPVVGWLEDEPLESVMAALRAWRRRAPAPVAR